MHLIRFPKKCLKLKIDAIFKSKKNSVTPSPKQLHNCLIKFRALLGKMTTEHSLTLVTKVTWKKYLGSWVLEVAFVDKFFSSN